MFTRCHFRSNKWLPIRRNISRKYANGLRIPASKSPNQCLLFTYAASNKWTKPSIQCANYVTGFHDGETLLKLEEDAASNSSFYDSLHQKLYPETTDPLLLAITEANSVEGIFSVLEDKELNEEHVSQAIISLWDLQKSLHHFPPSVLERLNGMPIGPSIKINWKILNEFIEVK